MGQESESDVRSLLETSAGEEGTTTVVEKPVEFNSTEFREVQIRYLAYQLWQERGYPVDDSPENDWYRAERILFGHKAS